jgi:hypothetical protein
MAFVMNFQFLILLAAGVLPLIATLNNITSNVVGTIVTILTTGILYLAFTISRWLSYMHATGCHTMTFFLMFIQATISFASQWLYLAVLNKSTEMFAFVSL